MRIEGSLRALLGSVALVAAIAGCVSAPSPRPSVELEGAIARTRARLLAEDPAWAAETEDFFGALVESAWRVAHAARYLDAPEFQPGRGIVGLPGLFNPDNRYTSALLDPNGAYRISGTRGTHALLSLQFLAGYPLVELSKGLDVIDLDAEGIAAGEERPMGDGAPCPRTRARSWRVRPSTTGRARRLPGSRSSASIRTAGSRTDRPTPPSPRTISTRRPRSGRMATWRGWRACRRTRCRPFAPAETRPAVSRGSRA